MKKESILGILAVVFLVCGLLVYAGETKPESSDSEPKTIASPKPRVQDPSVSGTGEGMTDPALRRRLPDGIVRPAPSMSPEERYRGQMLSQQQQHEALMKELTEIKKIAEEEGAEKTVEAIQKLIDKRTGEYQQSVQAMQKRRLEMQKRIEERIKAREQRSAGASAEETSEKQAAEQTQPDKKDDNK